MEKERERECVCEREREKEKENVCVEKDGVGSWGQKRPFQEGGRVREEIVSFYLLCTVT